MGIVYIFSQVTTYMMINDHCMMKDLHNMEDLSERERNRRIPHAIDTCHVVWVLRYENDYATFAKEFQELARLAASSVHFPTLQVRCPPPLPPTAARHPLVRWALLLVYIIAAAGLA